MIKNPNIMEENKMKKHVTVAAVLQIVFGALLVLGALVIVFAFNFAGQFIEDAEAAKILDYVMVPLVSVMCLFGAAMITGGIGLLACKPWGRILTLIMAGMGLLNIPIGTLKGVYIIWVLVQPETNQLFLKGCADSPAAQ